MLSNDNWQDELRPILTRKIEEAISEVDLPFIVTDDRIHLIIAITGIAMLDAMEDAQKRLDKQNGNK